MSKTPCTYKTAPSCGNISKSFSAFTYESTVCVLTGVTSSRVSTMAW